MKKHVITLVISIIILVIPFAAFIWITAGQLYLGNESSTYLNNTYGTNLNNIQNTQIKKYVDIPASFTRLHLVVYYQVLMPLEERDLCSFMDLRINDISFAHKSSYSITDSVMLELSDGILTIDKCTDSSLQFDNPQMSIRFYYQKNNILFSGWLSYLPDHSLLLDEYTITQIQQILSRYSIFDS